jgi:hypothetical protein
MSETAKELGHAFLEAKPRLNEIDERNGVTGALA